ncbi:sodium:solute symporter [Ruficoccus amylovorans]|uniref:Sodium:solute symporter n=1 Tax=Ruficoccus amylovorans TaxID=1804625 RepID=A0A842HIF5_9BACT|nr:sodium:solute symporter [Ruficoccus amylovorans]MBC2596139.1 sodium:solute symporter [Ruficoccus amylovorans]
MTSDSAPANAIDLAVIGLYFVLTITFALYVSRKDRSVEGITAASHSIPGWLCGLSIVGSFISSVTFLALPGKAFIENWNAYAFSLAIPVAVWVAVKYFVPFYRNGGQISAYSHLEAKFGGGARLYATLCFVLSQLGRIAIVTYLMAVPVSVFLGWDIRTIILVTGVSTTLYTFIGGITAVIWTDAIQALVLILGALISIALIWINVPGGAVEIIRLGASENKFSLGSLSLTLTESTFWVVFVFGLVGNLQAFSVDQNYVQRYHVATSAREANKAVWLGGLIYIPVSAVFFFIGTSLFAFYRHHPERISAELLDPLKGDWVFPYFISTEMPTGLTGLVIAAIFAAAMSTLSSSLNASATVIYSDIYRRYIKPDATERQSIRTIRLTTIAIGVVGTLLAILMIHAGSTLDVGWKISGIVSGGLFGLFLLSLAVRVRSRLAGAVSVSVGIVTVVWLTLSQTQWLPLALRSPTHPFLISTFGTLAVLATGFFILLLVRTKPSSSTN